MFWPRKFLFLFILFLTGAALELSSCVVGIKRVHVAKYRDYWFDHINTLIYLISSLIITQYALLVTDNFVVTICGVTLYGENSLK